MKILFLTQRYYPLPGGVETQTRLVAHKLSEQHHVEVAATTLAESEGPTRLRMLYDSLLMPAANGFVDEGIQVHALTPTPLERLRMLPIAVRALPRLQRHYYHELKAFGYRWFRSVYAPKLRALMRDFDVIHCVAGNYLGWVGQEVAEELDIPFVWTPYVHPGQHGDDEVSVAHYCRADAILALIETDRELLIDLGVPPSLIHLYGVVPLLPETANPDDFRLRHDLGTDPVVLFVGRMVDYKGGPTMVEAAQTVWEKHPDTHFLFAGSASAEAEAAFQDTAPRIQYLGRISEQEKADALAACTLFCMPSKYEILPAVYLEAWSYGKPVVGGPAHGLEALIEGNEAGLVTQQTPEAVSHTLIKLLDDTRLRARLGRNGKRLVQKRYSLDALKETLEKIYTSVGAAPREDSIPELPTNRVSA